MPLGKVVDLSPGHIVLDGDPAPPPAKAAQQLPLFSAHVYCGYGRPSQRLLSSHFRWHLLADILESVYDESH